MTQPLYRSKEKLNRYKCADCRHDAAEHRAVVGLEPGLRMCPQCYKLCICGSPSASNKDER